MESRNKHQQVYMTTCLVDRRKLKEERPSVIENGKWSVQDQENVEAMTASAHAQHQGRSGAWPSPIATMAITLKFHGHAIEMSEKPRIVMEMQWISY